MKKRALTLFLVLAMLLSACPIARATDDAGTRETSFFTQQPHADVDFSDMAYKHIDAAPLLEEMETIQALLPDAANADQVEERFDAVMDQVMEILTMYALVRIRQSQNVMDETAADEVEYNAELYSKVVDALSVLMKAILTSPCAAFLVAQLTKDDLAYYLAYKPMTEEELALEAREAALANEYYQASAGITVTYNGEEWDDDSLYDAYLDGSVTFEDYDAILSALTMKQNEVLGEIYLRMVDLRREIAETSGYDNYADYAYEILYDRDYTPEDIRAFHKAVKEGGFYELYSDLAELVNSEMDRDVFYGDYTDSLDVVETYIRRMSSEMAEAFAYMRAHGLYDNGPGDYKDGSGFTTMLYSYGAPFFFDTAYGMLPDFTTIVHEFGHYNNFYWEGSDWNDSSAGIDVAEVHSQGLELLFSHWYGDIFGDSGQLVLDYQLESLVSAIVEGALHDELQQYVYTAGDVTLEQINRKYRQLAEEYGLIPADDPREQMYGWVGIHHTFTNPCYYISYAVSAAGAFSFWLEMQDEDYFDVVDRYLTFTALSPEMGFQESFAMMGMDDPLSPEYMAELAGALREAMNVDERLAEMSPVDLTGEEWFYDPLILLFQAGLITADEDHRILPYDYALWRDANSLVFALTRGMQMADPAKGDEAITRGEFAALMAGILELTSEEVSPFSDTDDGSIAALAALDIVTGYGDGTFKPEQTLTRAEMYVVVYRTLMSMVNMLMEDIFA